MTTLSIFLIAYLIAEYRKVFFYSNSLIFTTRTNKVFPSDILRAMYSDLCPIHTLGSPLQAKLIFYAFCSICLTIFILKFFLKSNQIQSMKLENSNKYFWLIVFYGMKENDTKHLFQQKRP